MGQVAFITGGASGIGRALGEALATRGSHVALVDRDVERAREVASAVSAAGGSASAHGLDVRDRDAFIALAREVHGEHGRIDYLFNNAGIGIGGLVEDYQAGDWDEVLDVNVRGVAYGIDAVYPLMCQQGSGHIINTASMAGFLPMPGGASYAASKHAVVGMSKALRLEGEQLGVRVSVLCPGAIQTPILLGGRYGGHRGQRLSDERMKAFWDRLKPMNVDVFAREVLRDVDRNEAYIIVPRWWKAVWMMERLAPRLMLKLFGRMHAQQRKEMKASALEGGMVTATATSAEVRPH